MGTAQSGPDSPGSVAQGSDRGDSEEGLPIVSERGSSS